MSDYDKGMVNRRRVLGDAWVDPSLANVNSFNREFQDLITRHAWNDIWGRLALGDKTRRLMVLSTLIALKAYEEFALHVRAALDASPESRLTPDDIKEVILQAAIDCGVPAANHAFSMAGAFDQGTPPAMSEAIAAAIPDAQLRSMATAHLSVVEQPEAFAALVNGFIAGLRG